MALNSHLDGLESVDVSQDLMDHLEDTTTWDAFLEVEGLGS